MELDVASAGMDVFAPGSSSSSSSSAAAAVSASGRSAASKQALSELSEVSVKFVTRQPDLPQVPNTFLSVPVKLARYGLSEIVNALTQIDPPRPFDFLIQGEF